MDLIIRKTKHQHFYITIEKTFMVNGQSELYGKYLVVLKNRSLKYIISICLFMHERRTDGLSKLYSVQNHNINSPVALRTERRTDGQSDL